jgi:hypothetical protein
LLPGDFKAPKRSKRNVFLFASIGMVGLGGLVLTMAIGVFVFTAWMGLPLDAFGLNEGPDQPIAFPHTVHVQDLGMDCTFCHRTVTTEAVASIPSEGLCLTCHRVIGDDLPGVELLRELGSNDEPINWIRVHRVPDHVKFVHEAHIRAFSGTKTVVEIVDPIDRATQLGIEEARAVKSGATLGETLEIAPSGTCIICHGDVGSMVKVSQVRALKMGDCLDCHRQNSAPTDCTTCHY